MSDAVTVVTGARKGIGRFLAERYLAAGHKVVGCSRSESDLSAESYEHSCVDVADEDAVIRFFASIRKRYGRIDHLLNCAGVASMNHVLLTPGRAVRAIFETNVFGTFYCSREAAKVMQKQRFGRIVNFGSIAVPMKLEGEAAYAASKAAVVTLTEVMARELGPFDITVNVVGPTAIATDLIAGIPAERIDSLVKRQAIQRPGTMDDVAAVVDFFLAPGSSLITGQTVYLGGP
ncbi:MAG TPA: SDR family oxidoreductase [Thermoanaerobaculia bacterium]|nr:SDR family oxidoreductase [Thermoanaerobaculia bacterium]